MYRLVVSDDEFNIRQGLTRFIDWKNLGFEVVAQFEDGKEVIEYVESNLVDVVLTDVMMFQVSGLEVAEWIARNRPNIKVIILSGYKEFDYVRKALVSNVYDYILKPVDFEEMKQVFLRLKQDLEWNDREIHQDVRVDLLYKRHKQLLEFQEDVAAAVCSGNLVHLENAYGQWKAIVNQKEKHQIMAYVLQLLQTVYASLKQEGIYLGDNLKESKVEQIITGWTKDDLFPQLYVFLVQIGEGVICKKKPSSESLAERVREYIELHLAEDFSVDDIADSMYVSKSHLSREFKRQTDESIMNFAMHKRMEKTIELIKSGVTSPETLAKQVGYADTKYFKKVFKNHTGCTVKEFQRLHGEK